MSVWVCPRGRSRDSETRRGETGRGQICEARRGGGGEEGGRTLIVGVRLEWVVRLLFEDSGGAFSKPWWVDGVATWAGE